MQCCGGENQAADQKLYLSVKTDNQFFTVCGFDPAKEKTTISMDPTTF